MAADAIAWLFGAGGDYTERYEWLTDVPTAATGMTHHRRLRASPRVQIEFSCLSDGNARRQLEHALRKNAGGWWWIPISVDALRIGSNLPAGSMIIPVDPSNARFVSEGKALLQAGDLAAWEVVSIAQSGLSPSGILLEAPTSKAWTPGCTVTPLRLARLAAWPSIGRFTADASDIVDLQWRLEDPLEDPPQILGDVYRGFPVWPFAPEWSSGPDLLCERTLLGQDDGISRPVGYDFAGVPLNAMAMRYVMDADERVRAFRAAIFALAGRWQPVWITSAASDFRIVQDVPAGATFIDVEGALDPIGALDTNLRDLRIVLRDATAIYRRVTGVSVLAPGVQRLSLDSPIAAAFAASDVGVASWMTLCVQDADTCLIRYWVRDVAVCDITWRQIAHAF